MQQELLDRTSLSIPMNADEAPSGAHGDEQAAWISRRFPRVRVRYVGPVASGRNYGELLLVADTEDDLSEALFGWLAKETGPWPVIPEGSSSRATGTRIRHGHARPSSRPVRRWLRKKFASFCISVILVSGMVLPGRSFYDQ